MAPSAAISNAMTSTSFSVSHPARIIYSPSHCHGSPEVHKIVYMIHAFNRSHRIQDSGHSQILGRSANTRIPLVKMWSL